MGGAALAVIGAVLALFFLINCIERPEPAKPLALPGTWVAPEREAPVTVSMDKQVEPAVVEPPKPGLRLHGTVLSKKTGLGLDRVSVSCVMLPYHEGHKTHDILTSLDGVFTLALPPAKAGAVRHIDLIFKARGYRELITSRPIYGDRCTLELGAYHLHENRIHELLVKDRFENIVPGARLRLFNDYIATPMVEKVSDSEGKIRISDIELDRRRDAAGDMGLHITAPGMADYFGFRVAAMPKAIVMEPEATWYGRVEDAATGKGVAGAKIGIITSDPALKAPMERADSMGAVTDKQGRFIMAWPAIRGDAELCLCVHAEGYRVFASRDEVFPSRIRLRKAEAGDLDAENAGASPLLQDKLGLCVRDELGRPVVNAYARLEIDGDADLHCFTDLEGRGFFDLAVTEPTEAQLDISHPRFQPLRRQSVLLGVGEDESLLALTIQRATLYQNLRVVNERGEPCWGVALEAEVSLDNGTTLRIEGTTGADGRCDLAFPPFREGLLYAGEQPESVTPLSYAGLLANEPLSLLVYDENSVRNFIEGKVVDPSGQPVEGVMIQPSVMEGPQKRLGWMRTGNNGSFRLPASRENRYHVAFPPFEQEGLWYTAAPMDSLAAGSNLKITLAAWTGVHVDLQPILRSQGYTPLEYEAWLESPEGMPLHAAQIHATPSTLLFLGVPVTSMHAVIQTREGKRYRSPLLVLKKGMSLSTAFVSN